MSDVDDLRLSASDLSALGKFRSTHVAGSLIHKVNIAIASSFTVLLLVAAVFALKLWLENPEKGLWPVPAIFGGLALLPAVGLILLVRKLRWRLFLFDNGFVFSRGRGWVVLWDDTEGLYLQQDVITEISADLWLNVVLCDGRRIALDSTFKGFSAFAEAVRAGITRSVLRRAETSLPKGEEIPFGEVKLSRQGLEKKGTRLPWSEVDSITLEKGEIAHIIRVYRKGTAPGSEQTEWYTELVPKFQSIDAFVELAGQFSTVRVK